jgi:hypothetical protein
VIEELSKRPPEPIEVFAAFKNFSGKGPVAVGLFITDAARNKRFPLEISQFLTPAGGQIKGLGGIAVKRILQRHGIGEELTAEGGRTSRGSLQRASDYIEWLNRTHLAGSLDFDQLEEFWVSRALRELADSDQTSVKASIPDQRPAPAKYVWQGDVLAPLSGDGIVAQPADLADFLKPLRTALNHLIPLYAKSNQHRELCEIFQDLRAAIEGPLDQIQSRDFELGFVGLRLQETIAEYNSRNEELPTLDAGPLGNVKAVQSAYLLLERRMPRWIEFKTGSTELISATPNDPETLGIVEEAINTIAAEGESREQIFDPATPRSLRTITAFVRKPIRATKAAVYGTITSVENLFLAIASRIMAVISEAANAFQGGLGKKVGFGLQIGFLVACSHSVLKLVDIVPQNWSWFRTFLEYLGKHLSGI